MGVTAPSPSQRLFFKPQPSFKESEAWIQINSPNASWSLFRGVPHRTDADLGIQWWFIGFQSMGRNHHSLHSPTWRGTKFDLLQMEVHRMTHMTLEVEGVDLQRPLPSAYKGRFHTETWIYGYICVTCHEINHRVAQTIEYPHTHLRLRPVEQHHSARRCSAYYKIRWRYHCLFREGFGPLN